MPRPAKWGGCLGAKNVNLGTEGIAFRSAGVQGQAMVFRKGVHEPLFGFYEYPMRCLLSSRVGAGPYRYRRGTAGTFPFRACGPPGEPGGGSRELDFLMLT